MSPPHSPRADTQQVLKLAAIIAQACGALASAIGATALIGWIAGIPALYRVSTAFRPMTTSTALPLFLLGAAAFALQRWPERRAARRYVDAAAVFVCALTTLVVAQFVGGFDLGLETALSFTTQTFEGIRVGRMSPLSAGGLLLAALSLIALTTHQVETAAGRRAAAGMAFGTFAIGVATLAGYVLGAPLLYHSVVVPIALPTAFGLALLGIALVAAALARPTGLDADAAAGTTVGRSRRTRLVPIALAAGAGLLSSVVFAAIVFRVEEGRRHEDFARRADNEVGALKGTIYVSSDAVADVHDLFLGTRQVRRDEFRSFATAGLSRSAGIQTLDWAPRVADRQRAAYEAAARREGVVGFRFTELDSRGRLVPAARRAEYYPVFFLQAKQGHPVALGFDLASEPNRRAALERARDAGTLAVSAPLPMLLPGRPQGILLAYPVYRRGAPDGDAAARRAALVGFTVGAVVISDLVAASRRTVRSPDVLVDLLDVSDSARPALLYADASAAAPRAGSMAATTTFSVGGRTWVARMRPAPTYLATQNLWDAWLVFAGGLLLTFLIAAYLHSLERHSTEVEAAHRLVAESEGRFRAIAESAVDGIITIDATGTIVQCNAAAVREFGYEEGRLLGRNVRDIIPPSHVAQHTAGLARYRATGQALLVGEAHELPAVHRDGSEFPVELSLATWETTAGRFATAIIRNITDRKLAREESERFVVEMQDAVAKIKTLGGLVPICAWCKKIRDDKGYWTQLESYLSHHTTAEFSHSMCPDCEKKFQDSEG